MPNPTAPNIFSRVARRDAAAARVLAYAFRVLHTSGRPDHVVADQLWAAVRMARAMTGVDAAGFLLGRLFAPYFAGDPDGLLASDAARLADQAHDYLDSIHEGA
jgi:hypothetical protein